jgi:large subunit ribosomal protein L15
MIELKSVKTKNRKRPGHGISAGQGKTAGRGTKGQKSRAGHNIPKRFEGGQTPLSMRLPKLPGFKSHTKKAIILSLDTVSANFKNGETVTLAILLEKKLIEKKDKAVKILNNGKLTVKVNLAPEIKVSRSIEKLFVAPVIKEKIELKKYPGKAKTIIKTATKDIAAK